MPEDTTLYTLHRQPLSADQIQKIVTGGDITAQEDGSIRVVWPDAQAVISAAMPAAHMEAHLSGFRDYLIHLNGGSADGEMAVLLEMIGEVNLVQSVSAESGFDAENRIKGLILSMAGTYEPCVLFVDHAVHAASGQLVIGPPDAADFAEPGSLSVPTLDLGNPIEPTEAQRTRAEHSAKILAGKGVPRSDGESFIIPDDQQVQLRDPSAVAKRVLVLAAVVQLAQGRDREDVWKWIDEADVRDAISPAEREFLNGYSFGSELEEAFIWRLECIGVLMWALLYIDKFDWPGKMCDTPSLVGLILKATEDPRKFVAGSKLRDKKIILDAADLLTRLHRVVRGAFMKKEELPDNLDWTDDESKTPAAESAAVGVVAERHYAANWLIGFGGANWDEVQTPT